MGRLKDLTKRRIPVKVMKFISKPVIVRKVISFHDDVSKPCEEEEGLIEKFAPKWANSYIVSRRYYSSGWYGEITVDYYSVSRRLNLKRGNINLRKLEHLN